MSSCVERRLRNRDTNPNPANIYTWGFGQHGQLGHGDKLNRPGPAMLARFAPGHCCISSAPCYVAASGSRTAVLDEEGQVFVFGGATETEPGSTRPLQIAELSHRKIKQVACGALHMVALDATGDVLQWGNICGVQVPPSVVPFGTARIAQVIASGAYTIALSDTGNSYSWGCNSRGQLGLGDTNDRKTPQHIASLSGYNLIRASCGGQHSVFLSSEGTVFACGYNKYGQLGLGDIIDRMTPQAITGLPPISCVGCGDNHSLFGTQVRENTNQLFVCGRKGQCGIDTGNILLPQPLLEFNAVLQATEDSVANLTGNGAFNASHSAVLTRKGKLYMWGGSKYDQCGIWGKDNVPTPTVVEAFVTTEVSQVACGWMHTVVLSRATTVSPKCLTNILGDLHPLPTPVLLEILSYLSPKDLARVALTNSLMHQLANTDLLWQQLFRKSYTITPALSSWEKLNLSNKTSTAYKYALKLQPSSATDLVALWKIRYIFAANKKYICSSSVTNAILPTPTTPPAKKGWWFSFTMNFRGKPIRTLMVGLDAAGRTTILYKLKLGEVVTVIPTIGFNVEEVDIAGHNFCIWDVGGEDKIRALWKHYYMGTEAYVFVLDASDRERIEEASFEMHRLISEVETLEAPLLVFANKQDLPNALTVEEVTETLNLPAITNRKWLAQGSCAISGDGLLEGFTWLARTLSP
ncbi:ADP-ribosylation factor 1 [Pelomyxa schiedti]|nr:ADP-ribosylation factor 1 [Pelomyxa schiedti]